MCAFISQVAVVLSWHLTAGVNVLAHKERACSLLPAAGCARSSALEGLEAERCRCLQPSVILVPTKQSQSQL